jgi:hypothetical protein
MKAKKRKNKVDYNKYQGAVGKSMDRETAKKKWEFKATPEEKKLGSVLTQDDQGNYIRRTKVSSPAEYKNGGKVKSRVNEAGNYTKPGLRKRLFNRIKAGSKGGSPGQWSARKAQLLASEYKKAGGGYTN